MVTLLSIFLVSILAVVIFITINGNNLKEKQVQEALESSNKIFSALAVSALEPVISEDVAGLETIIEQILQQVSEIQSISINNEEKISLVKKERSSSGKLEYKKTFIKDIEFEGEVFGDITIVWNTEEKLMEIKKSIWNHWFSICLPLFFLTILLVISMHFVVVKPIAKIRDRIIAMHNGDLTTTFKIKGSQEIQLLGQTVNRLCHILKNEQYQKDELLRAKENAEKELLRRQKTEEERERLQAELLQSQKMEAIGTLAGGIAHDFNNILGAVLGFAELAKIEIQKGLKPVDDLDKIIKSADRAKELVKQILTYSRKESHKLEPVSLQPVIEESLKLLRATLPANIEIRKYYEDENILTLADSTKIQQVMINLCTNALHAMEDKGGLLTVNLTHQNLQESDLPRGSNIAPGQFLKITVSDTGQGMDPKTIERIFDPFFTSKIVGKGTGLGLSVVDGIIRAYKGFIKIDSTLGEGTSFYVYLPILQGDSIAINSHPEPRQNVYPTANKRVLVVDDEILLVKINKRRLENVGYEVTATTDSNEALEKIHKKEKFDLIVTDQSMPGLSGAELAEEVFKLYPDMPIIMCTGHSDMVSEEKALEMGIRKYVLKPIQGDELIHAVQEILETNK